MRYAAPRSIPYSMSECSCSGLSAAACLGKNWRTCCATRTMKSFRSAASSAPSWRRETLRFGNGVSTLHREDRQADADALDRPLRVAFDRDMPAPAGERLLVLDVPAGEPVLARRLAVRTHVDQRLQRRLGRAARRIRGLERRLRGRRVGVRPEAERLVGVAHAPPSSLSYGSTTACPSLRATTPGTSGSG